MLLQVALDFLSLDKAIRVAEAAVSGGANIIEAGTPLIKYNGIKAVKALKKAFPDRLVLADMKTVDAGRLEAEMAFTAGADMITVLAVSGDRTIMDALDIAKQHGGRLMVDLMRVKDIVSRALQLRKMGVDYILVHTGLDEQRLGLSPFKDLRVLSKTGFNGLAVAGGINADNILKTLLPGVEIVIVGGYITRSSDPEAATRRLINIISRR